MSSTQAAGRETGRPSIIQFLDEEIEDYEDTVKEFRSGNISDGDFMAYRVRMGVYGQRQDDFQMMRVKIPGGLLHADQLEALADITDRLAPLRKGHITTRENIQIHHLKLEGAAEAMHILQAVGISSKEACGNTVRNVTACPMAGVDPRQAFDIQPYLGAFVRNFVRRDFTHHMPRKVKPAFSCGEHDCGVTPMHDLGFLARVREVDGKSRKGFKITVGGGTSIQPLMAETLYDFVPVEDFLRTTEAVLRVYNRTAWLRRNIMKARIKVLIHAEGIESFRKQVEEELKEPWAQNYADRDDLLFHDDERADAPPLPAVNEAEATSEREFQDWKESNVTAMTETGYNFVSATIPLGDLTPEQFRGLGEIARNRSSHRLRLTAEQNLMFRWVPDAYLPGMYQDLRAIGLAQGGLNQITDVTSCPGTDSCKMGITSAMGLNRAVAEAINSPNGNASLLDDPLIKQMHIKMSGCPNGCGRHHLADIGFHGAFMKGPKGGQVPAYHLFLGGSYEDGDVRHGVRPRGKIPAKRVSEAVFQLLHYYKDNRRDGELFKDFAHRLGREPFEEIVNDLADIGPLNKQNIDLYMDYEKTVLYVMERGEGECSA